MTNFADLDECVKLANLVMPEIQKVLGRQRRDYNLSDDFKAEFPVEDQAENPLLDGCSVFLFLFNSNDRVGFLVSKLLSLFEFSATFELSSIRLQGV